MFKEIKGYNAGGIAGLPQNVSGDEFMEMIGGAPGGAQVSPGFGLLTSRLQPAQTGPEFDQNALQLLPAKTGPEFDQNALQLLPAKTGPKSGPPKNQPAPPSDTAAKIKDLEEEVKDSEDRRKTFDDRFNDYKSKLAPLFGAAPRRRNFYDLASALGAGILASDPTAGPYGGIARGFAQFNKDTRKDADEARNIQRQIALQAFQMAREDEKMATEYIQQAQIELIKKSNQTIKYITWEIPELDQAGQPTGKKIRRAAAETDLAKQQEYQALGGYPVTGGGTSVKVGGSTTSGFLKKRGEGFAKAVSKWGEEAALARTQKNLLDTASSLSAGLDADERGRFANVTLPLREFMVDLGWADAETIEGQQLVKSFGTRIAMGLIGQTKGAISNAEMTLFLASSPGLAMTKGGYDRLIGYLNRINQKSIDFQEAYDEATLSGEFDEVFESGNDAKIAAAMGGWQAQWHKQNPLFSDSEKPEIEELAGEESREARLLRQGFGSGSTSVSTTSTDVTGRF